MDDKRHIVAVTALIKDLAGDRFLILKRARTKSLFQASGLSPAARPNAASG
jgi:hypothetical protein